MKESSPWLVVVPTRTNAFVELPASVSRYEEAGLQSAADTKRGYAVDLRSFEDSCQHHQLGHLPAEMSTVAGYVSHLANRGKKCVTIRQHVLPNFINSPVSPHPPAMKRWAWSPTA